MSEKDEEIRIIIEKLDSKTPYDHFEEIIKFIEDDDNHKIIRKKNLISLFLHKSKVIISRFDTHPESLINFIMILLNASSMNAYANSTKEEECWSPYDEYIQEILAIKKEKRAFGLNLLNQIILNQKNKTAIHILPFIHAYTNELQPTLHGEFLKIYNNFTRTCPDTILNHKYEIASLLLENNQQEILKKTKLLSNEELSALISVDQITD